MSGDERPSGEHIPRRTVSSLTYTGAGSLVRVAALGVRSVVLARLLPISVFGVYAGTRVVIELVVGASELGLNAAMTADHEHTRDERRVAQTHLLLRTVITAAWAAVGLLVAVAATDGDRRTSALVLIGTFATTALLSTFTALLGRRVVHRRLALLGLLTDVGSTVVAVGLAVTGAGLWALLSVHVVEAVLGVLLLVVHRPVWRPSLRWHPAVGRHLLRFGVRAGLANLLTTLLAKIDDLFVATALGTTQLGLYNRAYTFASYPRKIAGGPVDSVSLGALAAAADRRARTEVFTLLLGLLVRAGFLLAGLLAVAAPELIRVLIGERWLPMLAAFQLMLVYAMFDPLKTVLGHVLIAGGEPGRLVRARSIQLAALLVGLGVLGWQGIAGVAVAVNLMAVAGTLLLLREARRHVDVDVRGIFGAPAIAFSGGIGAAVAVRSVLTGTWPVLAGTSAVFGLVFAGTLAVLERDRALRLLAEVRTRPWGGE
ncbi:MAG TPA: oligosaccharide flippase family protein [Euzebya sp.]|nr:oligosaccharide flippase family protein [Euzebya sp.]